MKRNLQYEFHHFGIPLQDGRCEGTFSEKAGMFTSDNPGKFKVQWHRFTDDSPLHPLLKTVPHVAFKVDNLSAAIRDEEIILGPYEPIDVKWFTEFGHLNRGDMLTSEQHRCHNEKKKFQRRV
ncbi:hypothetical protein AB4W76_13390 [Klebsiella pasteurii]|uniref:hypothetical protein n=1 Tax=Klebsiella pasteurii TaxID=2587529 RepID=UPI003AB2F744